MTHPADGEQVLLVIERSRIDPRHPSVDSEGASSIGASSAGASHAVFSARAARTGGPISSAVAVSGFVPRGSVAGVTVGTEHRYTEVAVQSPGDRLEELVQGGRSRRDALRQVARENMGAEVEAGLLETLALPGWPLAPRCCRCCQLLMLVSVFVIVTVFVIISVCFVFMNVCGWFLSLSLLFCQRQPALRHWLLVLQTLMLVEGVVGGVMHGLFRSQPHLASAYRVHVVVLAACYDLFSATFKVGWCVRTQQLVAATALALAAAGDADGLGDHGSPEAGCAESLPAFMHWFAWALLLQMVVVVPLSHVGAAAAFWAARRGLLPTRRGAKPGTLEALSTVDFDAELFANPDDRRDSRPQGECCCCLEEYSKEAAIIKTPCDHMMHRECLERWLHTSHFCPICRADLEDTGPDVGQV